MKRQRMAEDWDAFALAVLPANASWTQKLEMRRAFRAGAQAILFHVIVSFAEDIQMMEDLDQELKEFGEFMERDPKETSPKHLRVGVNSAMADAGAVGTLLIRKGLITEEEYFSTLVELMENEVESYRQKIDPTGRVKLL